MSKTDGVFQFERVVFFGRSICEYVTMFNLDLDQLRGKSVLDCNAGPAAFAAQAESRGIEVTAVDPMYKLSAEKLRACVDGDAAAVTAKQHQNKHLLHDDVVPTSERREAMEIFLNDFADSMETARYLVGELPNLPFKSESFDFVLSANFLFIYSDTASGGMLPTSPFDYKFHSQAIEDLCRICREEVRLYPLVGPATATHKYLAGIMSECRERGFEVTIEQVAQRDIIGAEQMLRLRRVSADRRSV